LFSILINFLPSFKALNNHQTPLGGYLKALPHGLLSLDTTRMKFNLKIQ